MEPWLPLIFVSIMGFALLVYIILDGYDLGIGILLPLAEEHEKDQMIASIGPFWDANETWIVLGIGVLLIAFPKAHGVVLTALYLPVTFMLIGLILRGVSFDFRAKAALEHKRMWNTLFFVGSLLASMAQGWMLGSYITGLTVTTTNLVFSALISLTLPALYIMLGCGWLFIKTEGSVYEKATRWAKIALYPMGLALLLISIATPIVSQEIAQKWFKLPEAIGLIPIPISCFIAYAVIFWVLRNQKIMEAGYGWVVFVCLVVICIMCSIGLGYSIYPDIIIGSMTIWETAAAPESLKFTLYGVVVAVPLICLYTIFLYRIFSGKVTELSYE